MHKPSNKTSIIIVLFILLLGIPLTLYQSQLQQFFKQFASQSNQSATAICSQNSTNLTISVQFKNAEPNKDAQVTVKDVQTGSSADLGQVKRGETKSGEIITESKSLKAGSVIFTIKWSDGSSDQYYADYKAVDACAAPSAAPLACIENQGYCRWDSSENTVEYKVVVKEKVTGSIVKEETVKHPKTESAFPMDPKKSYQCSVSVVNACGVGKEEKSAEKSCVPTDNTYCPANPLTESSCVWDPLEGAKEYKVDIFEVESGKKIKSETVQAPIYRLTYPSEPGKGYKCSVSAVNACSESPATMSEPRVCAYPSATPEYPTPTVPYPTNEVPTPTPTVAPTPTVIPTPTPTLVPTNTPIPTPTRIPTPTIRIVQLPPRVVQQPPRGGVQVVQQPVQPVQQYEQPRVTTVPRSTTPAPTVVPTGDNTIPVIAGGVTLIAAFIGAILFFAL